MEKYENKTVLERFWWKKEKKSNHNSFRLEESNVFLSMMIEYAMPSWRLRTMLFTRTARGWREKRCNCFNVSSFILIQDFPDIYVYVAMALNVIMGFKIPGSLSTTSNTSLDIAFSNLLIRFPWANCMQVILELSCKGFINIINYLMFR